MVSSIPQPPWIQARPSHTIVLSPTNPSVAYLGTTRLRNIHSANSCVAAHCIVHNPSDHHMRSWPMFAAGSGRFERICSHSMGHPDPDSIAYFEAMQIGGMDIHTCDGCCSRPWRRMVMPADRDGANKLREAFKPQE